MRLRNIQILALSLVFALNVSGQQEFKKGDKLLNLKAFELAINSYESGLKKHPDKADGYAKLAEAYRMTNQLLNAIKSYEKAFSIDADLRGRFQMNYAHTLKKVGLYEKAESEYQLLADNGSADAIYYLGSIQTAKDLLSAKEEFDIIPFDGNSERSDFGMGFYNDNLVFASFRSDLKRESDKKNNSYVNLTGNQLYSAKSATSIGVNDINFLRPNFKEIHGLGPLSYSKDGGMVAFMRNTFNDGSIQPYQDDSDFSIYFALTDKNGDFSDNKPFPYNQIEYSYAYPCLSFNGSALYFASNKPGGFGGFDLYVSYFKDGQWLAPQNLGKEINTPGNEITPNFDGEKLYFASDYRKGLGGYDNFVSRVEGGKWASAENMGKGINSPSDDYYLSPSPDGGSYYFTSNRLGGRGKDDIYKAFPLSKSEEILAVATTAPPAVDLEELAKANSAEMTAGDIIVTKIDPQVALVSSKESVRIVNEANSGFEYEDADYFDFSGAKIKTLPFKTEMTSARVYFIQLASFSKSKGDLASYNRLTRHGQLYRFFKNNTTKVRLGYYSDKSSAEKVLREVKNAGYSDAFITTDALSVADFEVVGSSNNASTSTTEATTASNWINEYESDSEFKVKLASYTDPLKFNVDAVQDLGRLEQWSKGQWTIFILGGYASLEEAQRAQIRAMNRGFADAELVRDDDGLLSRVQSR